MIALICSSCCATRIVTVSPDWNHTRTYSTSVAIPRTHAVTTTTRVIAADNDIALALDLQAVGAAFAQSSTVQEFENLLNNSSYMLSNLDLNGDGYVDYLRVLETVEGYAHVFLIQAVLDANVYQDVASIVAEVPTYGNYHVQVIGDPYIFGPKYIIEPVYIARPLIFTHICVARYNPWRSPWYWNHFPTHYRFRAPVYHGHYHAYVTTYMRNHHYCHQVHYVETYHYVEYNRVVRQYQRNDYGRLHPEHSFTERNADIIAKSRSTEGVESTRAINARLLSENREAEAVTRTTTTNTNSAARSVRAATQGGTVQSSTSRSSTASGQRSTSASSSRSTTTTGSRSTGTTTSGATVSGTPRATVPSASSSTARTTVKSSVNNSGSSSTRINGASSSRSTSASGSRSTSPSTATRSSSPSRSSASSASSSRSSSAGSSTGRSGTSSSRR